MICDMSSNITTKPIDWSKYDVVYAGAQKNLGPSGCTLVVVRNSVLDQKKQSKNVPVVLDWNTYRHAPGMFHNTPACFPIYAVGLNVAHMLKVGGVPAMQKMAEERSQILYDFLDSSDGYFVNYVDKKYRSRINVPFRVRDDPDLEAKFLAEAAAAGFIELKGHVSTGGCRASMYNAMPVEGVKRLVEFMRKFQEANPAAKL